MASGSLDPSIPAAVLQAAREAPWPYPKGQGHLGVKWKFGVEKNKAVLDEQIAKGSFTAAQGLHRMTIGMVNADDGVPNGPGGRPTLAMKWGPGGVASVRQPASVVDAHVEQLRQHLANAVAAQLARRGGRASTSAPVITVDLVSDDDDNEQGSRASAPAVASVAATHSGESASLALARRLQAEEDAALAAEVAAAANAAEAAAATGRGTKRPALRHEPDGPPCAMPRG